MSVMKITLKDIIPHRFHCSLGMHSPFTMVHPVTYEPQEDICTKCGICLAEYKTVKVKPKKVLY